MCVGIVFIRIFRASGSAVVEVTSDSCSALLFGFFECNDDIRKMCAAARRRFADAQAACTRTVATAVIALEH
jgi:hypothetical protein